MDVKTKRSNIEKFLYELLAIMDPSKVNMNKYKALFAKMSDQQFSDWMTKFLADEKSNIRVDIEEFGNDNRKLKFENVEKAAEYVGVPLFEYVYVPHVSSDPNHPVRSREKVLVGYLNIKRPQQLVTKKTGYTLSDTDRDEFSGSATGESRGGTTTGIENELLAGVGADKIISELLGVRGDNVKEYDNMLESITETGSVKLEDIKTSKFDKPTLLKTDIMFMCMGLKTDIVSDSYYSTANIRASLGVE